MTATTTTTARATATAYLVAYEVGGLVTYLQTVGKTGFPFMGRNRSTALRVSEDQARRLTQGAGCRMIAV